MRVLFIVPYVPNLIRVRPYNLIKGLAARGNAVTVATLWSSSEERADLQTLEDEGIEVIAAPLLRPRSLWNCLRALSTRVPLQAVYCWQPNLKSQISNLKLQTFDVIHVEHLRGARYGLYLKSQMPDTKYQIPVVWDSVDCISYLFEQAAAHSRSLFGRLVTRLELTRTRRYEGWLVGQFDRVLVTSPIDKAALERLEVAYGSPSPGRRGGRGGEVSVLRNGVDLAYFCPDDTPRDPATVVFSGKMSYHANVTAALHLMHDIMPRVWAQRPDVKVVIAGKDPPSEICNLQSTIRNLAVTGTVPDIRPYLRQATAAVVPTPYGAGIQNKVLEAMACGTPVVASPQAVSALQTTDGEDVLLAEEPEAFAQAVLRLLEDGDLQQRLGRAGRRYVEHHHDWRTVAERLEAIYQETKE